MPRKTKKIEFAYRSGGQFAPSKVSTYGREIVRLQSVYTDGLTPEIIVTEAESTTSPLHDAFEWNDQKAAHKYRLVQARNLITHIEIKYVTGETRRLAYNIKRAEGGAVYVPSSVVSTQSEIAAQLLNECLGDFDSWRDRFDDILALSSWKVASDFRAKLSDKINQIRRDVKSA